MRTGELAERAGIGVETVRYYERRGLLAEPVRDRAGYRRYDGHDLLRLRFIMKCKELGFTLTEIRDLLELRLTPGRTAEDVRRQARRKLDGVNARIADLERIAAALRRLMETCDGSGPPEACALMHAVGGDENF
jgi:MerR family transcriptional regulator, copper efflux regulator